MHLQFFVKISKNRDYVKTFCTDLNNPFRFGIRKEMITKTFVHHFRKLYD